MAFRISTNQLYDQSLRSILDNQSNLANLQQQLATGKKLLQPSDDPVGAAKVVRLTEDLAQIEQFNFNNDLLQNSLEQEEAVLSNINTAMNRARVLMVQAGNGVLSEPDREAISVEIGQIRDQVFDLMNSRNANGEYIFAGYQSESAAFTFDPTASGNKYQFNGDSGINKIQVSESVFIQSNSSGFKVFENVPARLDSSITASTAANASSTISQQSTFDGFHEANYDPLTPANNNFRITVLPAGDQVQIDNLGTGATVGTQGFVSGQPFVFNGIEFDITGAPGDTVDFQLEPPAKKNIAETLNDFFVALTDPSVGASEFSERVKDALEGTDNGLLSIANATASIGGRINVATSVFETNLDLEIANQAARATIEDVDFAEAISELSKQETALQAAQATFSRVTGLSLFDFI